IDLQKAGVVVNYDLPWNPMVVEQRIGRVDRIGQKNPVIHIANMVVQGTIEERILTRLYHRIGIFTDTIGEIDPILGQKVQELAVDVLLDRLTEEEKDKRIEEASLIVERVRQTTRAIGEQADDLLAADQAFLDELNALVDRRRLPLKAELYNFFKDQMEKMYAGVRISPNLVQGVDDIRLPNDAAIDLQKKITHDTDAARVSEIVLRGPFKSTFEQEKAMDFPRAELIHANHPLMKLAIHSFEQRLQEYPRVFLLELASEDVEPTRYIMCTYLYSIEGVAERVILRPFVLRLNDLVFLEESLSEDIFIQVLERGLSPQQRPRWGDQELTILGKALDKLDQEASRYRGLLQQTEGQIEEARLSRRKITIENTLQRKIDQARARLTELENKGAAEFAIHMARAKLQRRLAEKKERMSQLPNAATLSVHYEKLTTGVLEIGRR
ncbi:MAG: helicase-related protein, partial [Candidatus Hodarchaeota archaeon]